MQQLQNQVSKLVLCSVSCREVSFIHNSRDSFNSRSVAGDRHGQHERRLATTSSDGWLDKERLTISQCATLDEKNHALFLCGGNEDGIRRPVN